MLRVSILVAETDKGNGTRNKWGFVHTCSGHVWQRHLIQPCGLGSHGTRELGHGMWGWLDAGTESKEKELNRSKNPWERKQFWVTRTGKAGGGGAGVCGQKLVVRRGVYELNRGCIEKASVKEFEFYPEH